MTRFLALCACILPLGVGTAHAAESPYSPAAFSQLLAKGEPVAVVFHADWCPTCRAQAPVLKELADSKEFAKVNVLVADFDHAKDARRSMNVSQQSTVVAFKAGKEVGRSTGVTDRDGLAKLLRLAAN